MDVGIVTVSDEEYTAQELTEQSDKESDRIVFLVQASRSRQHDTAKRYRDQI